MLSSRVSSNLFTVTYPLSKYEGSTPNIKSYITVNCINIITPSINVTVQESDETESNNNNTRAVRGPRGPKGAQGSKGPQGSTGPKGSRGPKGQRGPEGKSILDNVQYVSELDTLILDETKNIVIYSPSRNCGNHSAVLKLPEVQEGNIKSILFINNSDYPVQVDSGNNRMHVKCDRIGEYTALQFIGSYNNNRSSYVILTY
jgi:hypothetical protein